MTAMSVTDPAPLSVADLDTPVVTINLDAVERNIKRVQARFDRAGMRYRPHIKTHKLPEMARRQLAAGAAGIACQKVSEAEPFVDAGVADDLLITYNLLGATKLDRLMALAPKVKRLTVMLDDIAVARGLSEAAMRAGVDGLHFLVDCDTGYRRTGVASPQAALDLAREAMRLPRLEFAGLMTHPSRPGDTPAFFAAALELFARAGIPVPVVSGGGTAAATTPELFPQQTEHRAGTCIYNDTRTVANGHAAWEDTALRVRATVAFRPADDRAVLDSGSKVLTSDQYGMPGYGRIMEYPEARIDRIYEEHAVVDLSDCRERPKLGEVVSIVPNHCCVVSNMFDRVYGIRGDRVEAVWPVAARGLVW